MELVVVTSTADAGRRVSELYPALAGCDLTYVPHDLSAVTGVAQLVFLAVPHTAAMALVPGLLEADTTVIDASADFRLRDPGVFFAWYGTSHTCPELLSDAVYGLPELWREALRGARLVACPGCYPTATLLAAAPAIEADMVLSSRVIVDAKSGVSGAGRSPSVSAHFVSAAESVSAYKVGSHRHTPEIAQGLEDLGLGSPRVTFSPHLVPMSRGLLSTVYLSVDEGLSAQDAHAAYADHYAAEPFVTVHPLGVMPSTSEVRGSNRAHIGLAVDGAGMLVVSAAIDNLVKGTAGQALQCANLALGYEETAGLDRLAPVF